MNFALRLPAILLVLFLSAVTQAQPTPPSASLPPGLQRSVSLEGVTEYRLENGLKLLLVPDDSVDTVTVNMTYLVGSRNEGYGESGMAHLLEHLLFRGTPSIPKSAGTMRFFLTKWQK